MISTVNVNSSPALALRPLEIDTVGPTSPGVVGEPLFTVVEPVGGVAGACVVVTGACVVVGSVSDGVVTTVVVVVSSVLGFPTVIVPLTPASLLESYTV